MFRKMFANTLYIQVRKNAFRVRHVEGRKERELAARHPFTTTRLLVGQFREAAALLGEGVGAMGSRGLVRPVVVLHPMDMVEGGLSEVEERVLVELAKSIGARKVLLHLGPVLTDPQVLSLIEGKGDLA